jgi:hypothetical protein
MKVFLCCIVVFGLSSLARAAGTSPYMALEISGTGVTVIWTNWSEVHLEESTDLQTWTRSQRTFDYLNARARVPLAGPNATRFFRLAGHAELPPRLSFEMEPGRRFVSWPHDERLRLQSRVSFPKGAWSDAREVPEVVGGHKSITLPPGAAPVFFRVSRPINHVLMVGQSLSIGAGGLPLLSVTQPYANKMFAGQAVDSGRPHAPPFEESLTGLVPLVEGSNTLGVGETMASGFANSVSFWLGKGEHDLLVSSAGRGGAPYDSLKKGTTAYARGLNHIAAGKSLCGQLGYQFQAVFVVHGEADHINPDYRAGVRQWQADYEADAQILTGGTGPVPMFHSQISAWGNLNAALTISPFLVLAEHEANPLKTVLVGPKYVLPYSDGLHLDAEGYRWLGEYYAKAYRQHVIEGRPFTPLRPVSITRDDNVIDVTFTGNVGPLVLDTNLVTDPRRDAYVTVDGASVAAAVVPDHDVVVIGSHSLVPGDMLMFHGNAAPGGLPFGTPVFVRSAPDSTCIEICQTNGGPKINFTSAGEHVLLYRPAMTAIGPFGFEYYDDEGGGIPWRCATTITDVQITGTNQLRITLSKTPVGTNRRLRYAYTATPSWRGGMGGPQLGPRGCLRDSDPTISAHGNTLHNWSVHFDKPVP